MPRPCFLVIDREYEGNISTRKLVIETAKLNVLTAYSGSEGIKSLKKFPNVDGIVIDAGIEDVSAPDLVVQLKEIAPNTPVIVIRSPRSPHAPQADYELDSFEPARLLELLKKLKPAAVQANEKNDARLADKNR